ncbi:MAG: S8 family peptidase [Pirellulaceae bacterium]
MKGPGGVNIFDNLVNIERLRELASRGTGRGVRVAILDTGVDDKHPDLAGAVKESYAIVRRGPGYKCVPVTDGDPVGHGTACAGIIHSIAPEAELYSVRVMGHDASGTLEQLTQGIRWALEQKYDVVNLSLGTLQKRNLIVMHELIEKAYVQGQIVVAAANNQRRVSYPAQFATVVSVDNEAFEDRSKFFFNLGSPIEIVAHGIYVEAPAPGGGYRLYTGTSFACPHISGIAACLRSEFPELTAFQLKSLLWCLRHSDVEQEESADDRSSVASAKTQDRIA